MSSFTNSTLPVVPASSSRAGSIALHGPHHGAQKSTTTGFPDCSTSRSNVSSVTERIASPSDPEQRNAPDRLEDDRPAHLRLPDDAVDEGDRDLDHLEAGLFGAIGHLDLERVTARGDRVELELLQHPPPEALEAARGVLDAHPEKERRVHGAAARDQPAREAPVSGAPTRHIPR